MEDDIFGEPPAALDTSDIDDRWEPVTDDPADAVAEHDVPDPDEDPVDDEPVIEDDADDADDEPAGDDADPVVASDPALDHELVKGKTPEQLAKLAVDSHTMIGRQSAEVAELRRVTSEQAEQLRELIGYLQQPQLQPQVDTSDVVAQALDNPQAAYQRAVQLVDGGHATPDLVDEVIEAVEDLSPKLARQMASDFTRRMVTAELRNEMRQELETRVAPLAKNDYQSQVAAASNSLYADPELGADAKAYEKEVVALLKGQNLGSSAQEIRAKLESALTVARGQDPTKSSKYKQALEALKADAQTEAGNAPDAPAAKKSEADQYRERAFARKLERDPGAAIFDF